MSSAKFTLIGCYQYYNNKHGDLFEKLTLPEGLNKDILTSNILLKGGEFEVQSGSPVFIHDAIEIWAKVYEATFTRWLNALAIEYAPLENYDRMEHWTDERDTAGSLTGSGTSNSTGTLDTTYDEDTERTKSAYDSSSYQPYDKVDTHATTDTDTTDQTTTSVNNSTTGSDDSEHNGRVHGNIGVTTSQQMLNQELDLGYWVLYERITDLFLREFVIPVYE